MTGERDPFRGYHRYTGWITAAKVSATLAGAVALATGLTLLVAAAPSAGSLRTPPLPPAVPGALADAPPTALPEPLPDKEPSSAALVEPQPLPTTGPSEWSIDIDTTGYQDEIDQCLWVRMDIGAVAPLVGAHNYCGGEIVLRMRIGDTVELRGTSLDGVYSVTESRDAWAGDPADSATSGMTATVILQTCYWNAGGKERLLSLVRAGQ